MSLFVEFENDLNFSRSNFVSHCVEIKPPPLLGLQQLEVITHSSPSPPPLLPLPHTA